MIDPGGMSVFTFTAYTSIAFDKDIFKIPVQVHKDRVNKGPKQLVKKQDHKISWKWNIFKKEGKATFVNYRVNIMINKILKTLMNEWLNNSKGYTLKWRE